MSRRLPPEAALARLLPLRAAIGVTRLAVLTGLDLIGLPVAAAVRPNSRTLAVHQGKGETLAAAKVGALMEALECFCAEALDLPLRLGTAEEMGESAPDVNRLPRCRGGPDPAGERLLWVAGCGLFNGRPLWVPRELVAADFALPAAPGSGVFQATTTGLASAMDEDEAVLHALHEAIERDAMALWHGASEQRQRARVVDPDSVDGPRSAALLARCRAAGVVATVFEVTSDVALPVFAAMLTDPHGLVQPELGSACRLDPDAALAAALMEAAQARATSISGARDDLTAEAFALPAAQARAAAASAWRAAAPARRFAQAPRADAADPLAATLRALERAGIGEAASVTLTRPELGVPVVRVVVPGLEGPWGEPGGEYVPGARARAAA